MQQSIEPEVVEAASLAHDIGHPPFGHIAEEKLDALMVSDGDPDGFEGNAQSFRIVTKLATRPNGRVGLNLTRACLQGLTKYPWERATTGKHHRKYGTYAEESDDFEWSRSEAKRDQQTPEAMIMDWADDVAYALHDLEDFCQAGFIPIDRLARDQPTQDKFLDRTRARWRSQGREVSDTEWKEHERVAEVLFAQFPTESEQRVIAQFCAVNANLFASGLTADGLSLAEDPDMRRQLDLLKSMTWTYVIESPALAAQQHGQRKVIESLLEYFSYACESARHSLPSWVRDLPEDANPKSSMRLACDVVASLSESEATVLHGRITGREIGSIYEAIGA